MNHPVTFVKLADGIHALPQPGYYPRKAVTIKADRSGWKLPLSVKRANSKALASDK